MFDQGTVLLEVFLFDFTGDLYGEVVDVAFVDWIRPELKFDSIEDLVQPDGRGFAARARHAGGGAGRIPSARTAVRPSYQDRARRRPAIVASPPTPAPGRPQAARPQQAK